MKFCEKHKPLVEFVIKVIICIIATLFVVGVVFGGMNKYIIINNSGQQETWVKCKYGKICYPKENARKNCNVEFRTYEDCLSTISTLR